MKVQVQMIKIFLFDYDVCNSIGSADRDGNELQSLRREEDLRQGRISNETDPEHKRVGSFEKHTKVISFNKYIVIFHASVYETVGYWKTFIRTSRMA
jgi:hypothetical protein